MLYSMTGYGRYQRNPTCISGVCALDTKDLHAAQVGKHSTLSKIMLLITLTMKCTFSQSCFFFSFIYGSLFFWGLIIAWYFFFWYKKIVAFLDKVVLFEFYQIFWWLFRLDLNKCHNSVRIRDDTHMTSMKIVQFSRSPTHLVHLRPKFFHPLALGRPISNEHLTSFHLAEALLSAFL